MTSPKSGGSDDDGGKPIAEGAVSTNQEGPDDLRYGELLRGKISVVPPGAAEWAEEVKRLPGPGVTIDGELAHAHFQTDDSKPTPPGPSTVHDVVPVPLMAPMIATVGAITFHGSPLAPGIGSVDVYAEGKPVFRMLCDVVACPMATPLPHGGGVVMPMGPPPSVFVNGFAIARAGDAVMEALGGPNPIMLGATTVFSGAPAPPMMSVDPIGRPAGDERPLWKRGLEWVDEQVQVDVRARADVHLGEASGKGDAALAFSPEDLAGGPEVHVEGDGTLVRVDGEVVVELSLFGETLELIDAPVDLTVGKWKGHGDVIFDPLQRRPVPSGDAEFEWFPEEDDE